VTPLAPVSGPAPSDDAPTPRARLHG